MVDFYNKSKTKKFTILIGILEIFVDSENIFREIYFLLKKEKENVSEKLLDGVYKIISDILTTISNESLGNTFKELEKLKIKLQGMKQEERNEKISEIQEAEKILEKL